MIEHIEPTLAMSSRPRRRYGSSDIDETQTVRPSKGSCVTLSSLRSQ